MMAAIVMMISIVFCIRIFSHIVCLLATADSVCDIISYYNFSWFYYLGSRDYIQGMIMYSSIDTISISETGLFMVL